MDSRLNFKRVQRHGHSLTPRQLELLAAVMNNPNDIRATTLAIAMNVSRSTVKTYLSQIYLELHVKNLLGALLRADELGFIDLTERRVV